MYRGRMGVWIAMEGRGKKLLRCLEEVKGRTGKRGGCISRPKGQHPGENEFPQSHGNKLGPARQNPAGSLGAPGQGPASTESGCREQVLAVQASGLWI